MDDAKNSDDIWLVIAAYKEEKKIASVIESLHKGGYKNVVVINDGSPDSTGVVAKQAGAIVLNHSVNRGQGAALKTGIDYALSKGAEIILTFDGDGQHQVKDIKNLILPIQHGEYEAVLGSRFLEKESNVSWHRKIVLKAGTYVVWLFSGIKLSDSHNGFRAFSADAASRLELTADRMEHASEIIEQIAKQKIRFKEVPVTITYSEYSLEKGQSTLAAFGILWNMVKGKLLR
jgi:polyprenyl-phospho-N-acetylgalactosaminyl synthase